MTKDLELYKQLISHLDGVKAFTTNYNTYKSQFQLNDLNEKCYSYIYTKLREVVPRISLFKDIPELNDECKSCWRFYLAPRNNSVRILDVKLGEKFQQVLRDFLVSIGIDCRSSDLKRKIYPDNAVYKEGKITAYLEVKYQSAPWILAYKHTGGNRECYEGSPALDIKKLTQQLELVQSEEITEQIYYVYWLDFPCIKGVYYMSIQDMAKYYLEGAEIFERKERSGDFSFKGGKVVKKAATSKIHPSVFMMKPFSSLIAEVS